MNDIEKIVPDQQTGGKTDVEESVACNDEQEARDFFRIVKERLQNVNRWHDSAGKLSADFHLTDASGDEVSRLVQEGDYIRIKIPAPGTKAGEGYDWVKVEKIEDKTNDTGDHEAYGMTVRPASHPNNSKEDTAHFFEDKATSSFLVKRTGNEITGAVRGRNEVPNTATGLPLDKARNALVGVGAVVGLSNPNWKSVVNGWLRKV
jgi:hypothetical protein